jgi:hypothetical protein
VQLEALIGGEGAPDADPPEEERNAEARRGRTVPVPQVIHGLLAARRRLERALGEGTEPVSEAVVRLVREDVIAHEAAHRAQIEAVKPTLGAARAPR